MAQKGYSLTHCYLLDECMSSIIYNKKQTLHKVVAKNNLLTTITLLYQECNGKDFFLQSTSEKCESKSLFSILDDLESIHYIII